MTLDSGFYFIIFFNILKNSSCLFSMKCTGNSKSLQHFLIIEKFGLGGAGAERRTIQTSCVLQYEKAPFFSGGSCGSITGEKLECRRSLPELGMHSSQRRNCIC